MLPAMADVHFTRLGQSGLSVSTVGLGTNNFGYRLDAEQSKAVIDAAIDEGITLFDTADSYGASEEVLGEALKGRRDQVVLATKFGSDLRGANGPDWGARGSRRYIRTAVERSLRRLQTDWIDLYQLHRPDPRTPLEETLAALTELVHEGKVRYIGSSNFAGWQVADAEWIARSSGGERFISVQNRYSLLDRRVEREVARAAEHYGIGILPYFPLESGFLTGKYRRGAEVPEGTRYHAWNMKDQLSDDRFDVLDKLEAFAAERSVSLLDLAIGGLAAKPAVASVIAGATSAEQVRANVAAGQWRPTAEDLASLDEITQR
jgi:aryl-alcohol dehydrogenase-like predicted oxidoreductase